MYIYEKHDFTKTVRYKCIDIETVRALQRSAAQREGFIAYNSRSFIETGSWCIEMVQHYIGNVYLLDYLTSYIIPDSDVGKCTMAKLKRMIVICGMWNVNNVTVKKQQFEWYDANGRRIAYGVSSVVGLLNTYLLIYEFGLINLQTITAHF